MSKHRIPIPVPRLLRPARYLDSMFRRPLPPADAPPHSFAPPETLVEPRIFVIRYDAESVDEQDAPEVREIAEASRNEVVWVDVQGLGNEAVLFRLAEKYAIHPMALADIVNVPQRPKSDDYGDSLLLVSRMVLPDADADGDGDLFRFRLEQVSVHVTENVVVTFQEGHGDTLDALRRRIRAGKGPIRRAGAVYLAYAIVDTLVDGFYPVVETLGDHLDELEKDVLLATRADTLREITRVRRHLVSLSRIVRPQALALQHLLREREWFGDDEVRVYLKDTYDNAQQITEVVESYREIASALSTTYMTALSSRTNEVMKVLTIVSTIFIPLTFIVGVYGMNFRNMPELGLWWAYPVLWVVMVGLAALMVQVFRRRGWFESSRLPGDDPDDGPARREG